MAQGRSRGTSRIVAAPKSVAEATVPAAAQAALAQPARRTLWSPRTGLTDTFDDWKHETLMLLAGLGFNSLEELLAWLPPTKVQTAQPQGANTRTTRTRDADDSPLRAPPRPSPPLPAPPRPSAPLPAPPHCAVKNSSLILKVLFEIDSHSHSR